MVSNSRDRWTVYGSTFLLWALLAASAVYWGMKLSSAAAPPPAPAAPRAAPVVDPVAVARLLGAGPSTAAPAEAAPAASRFALLGVVANASSGAAALITVDGRPARPFRVGTQIEPGLVLQSVDTRHAKLGPDANGPATVTLELPQRKQ
jgi:general secretion pathway protein C